MELKVERLAADLLIIGGGTAGCYAALTASRQNPKLRILLAEKANIRRSGCLAAGVNAINAYLAEGQTPEDYLEFVRWDAAGIIRDDLVLTMAQGINAAIEDLESLGLVIQKDENRKYVTRGAHNIKINGENIKLILSAAVNRCSNVTVLNHVNITDYLLDGERVRGAAGFHVRESRAYLIQAKAVICATGGAAGMYRPNNPGFSKHKMWYPPFNTGAGYALGIRAGAEMTTFEMRFVAQRCKDTIAPTGTIALGVGAKEINGRGEVFEKRYGLSTSGRAYGVINENREGRGPCYLQTKGITHQQDEDLLKAYLNMAPSQTLKWIESGKLPSQEDVEVQGSEPYVVGGHTASGYWIDAGRRTTLKGLYAAGDVAGGAPKKFVAGAMVEGKLAAETALIDLEKYPDLADKDTSPQEQRILAEYQNRLKHTPEVHSYRIVHLEEAMQKIMDDYAGGLNQDYRYNQQKLSIAQEKIQSLISLCESLTAEDTFELLHIYELKDRLTVCLVLLAHLKARKETRWYGFGVNTDYPEPNEHYGDVYINSRFNNGTLEVFERKLVQDVLLFS